LKLLKNLKVICSA